MIIYCTFHGLEATTYIQKCYFCCIRDANGLGGLRNYILIIFHEYLQMVKLLACREFDCLIFWVLLLINCNFNVVITNELYMMSLWLLCKCDEREKLLKDVILLQQN